MEDGDYKLMTLSRTQTSWNQKLEIPKTSSCYLFFSLLPYYQPFGRKSYTLQPSPQILPLKTLPWKSLGNSGLLSTSHQFFLLHLHNKYSSAPNSRVSACSASWGIKHTNLCLTTLLWWSMTWGMPRNCGRRKKERGSSEGGRKEEWKKKETKRGHKKEGNLNTEGRSKNTDREVHNLTHSKMRNLLKELKQQTDKKLLIDFCASAK